MGALGSKLRKLEGGRVAFWCPGCDMAHHVIVDGSRGWTWDGDAERPTIRPSILVTGCQRLTDEEYSRVMEGEIIDPKPLRCHSFITAGCIRFLNDCTHDLAKTEVELPGWPQ